MKILLTGGGTAGSVAPLLAIAQKMPNDDFFFIGTKDGPEKKLVEEENIKFSSILSGKFRRYFSWRTPLDVIKVCLATIQSFFLLGKLKPDVIISAGSFISPPVIWAGRARGIPSLVHHADLTMTLATKLMKKSATKLTKAFPEIPLEAECTGNPVRNLSPKTDKIKIKLNLPTVLVIGGGLGAQAINKLVSEEILRYANLIHVTGKGKKCLPVIEENYFCYDFLIKGINEAYEKADLIISRAGISTISELSILGKAIVLIPIPDSPQEENAKYLEEKGAAVVYSQDNLTPQKLSKKIKLLLEDKNKINKLEAQIKKINDPHAAEKIAQIIHNLQKR